MTTEKLIHFDFTRFINTKNGTVFMLLESEAEALVRMRSKYPNRTKNLSDEQILSLLDIKD